MNATTRRSVLVAGGAVWLLVSTAALVNAADPDSSFQRVGDLVVYFGVVPAAITQDRDPAHAGQGMHGGPPQGRWVHHLIVALFDAATGTRITDAKVMAVVRGRRHGQEDRIALEPMLIDRAPAYGGFATLPPRESYRIEVEALRAGTTTPVRTVFQHRHFQP